MTERATTPTAVEEDDEVIGAKETVESVTFLQRFTILSSAARELWLTFGLKFFAVLSWSLMNRTIPFWLQSDLQQSDEIKGTIIAVWSAIMTLVTVLVGSFTDAVGLRRTFLLGAGVCMGARIAMTMSVNPVIALGIGMLPVAVGEALLSPVMVAATKRYATTAQRSIAFSLIYAIMNVAFLVAGNVFDFVRKGLGEQGHYTIPYTHISITTYETLLLLSFLSMAPVLVLSLLLRPNVEVTDEGLTFTEEQKKYPTANFIEAIGLTARDTLKETIRIFSGLWSQPGFIRFLVFLLFATFMRMIFFHTSYTLAPMGVRVLGDGAPVGRLDTINNWLIIILVPIVGALTQRVSAYKMVVFGSILGAASVFIMAVPVHVYQPLANGWLGELIAHRWLDVPGPVNPWYISIALFYVAISFGEAFYSPRLYEYAAVIAPKGQEASYMSLSYLPFFGAKLTVGLLSGFLLAAFCPPKGPRHPEMLWIIIGVLTAVAPVGLLAFRGYIQVKEEGREG
ncbi:MAG TPA: MFS transporter [Tepidisphaeraceae bacterium]|jgi:MFS family permease